MTQPADLDSACEEQLSAPLAVLLGRTKRELGFVTGGPVDDSFFDALPDDELAIWEVA